VIVCEDMVRVIEYFILIKNKKSNFNIFV